LLNDNDEGSGSTQSGDTNSGASGGYHDICSTSELDAASPHDPPCRLISNGIDLAPQLLSNLTAATNSNDGAAGEESFLPIIGSKGEPDTPHDSTSELIDDGFDLASQLLFSCSDDYNNSITNNECLPLTKRHRSTLSCSDPALV
jgi:hypothetical protein